MFVRCSLQSHGAARVAVTALNKAARSWRDSRSPKRTDVEACLSDSAVPFSDSCCSVRKALAEAVCRMPLWSIIATKSSIQENTRCDDGVEPACIVFDKPRSELARFVD